MGRPTSTKTSPCVICEIPLDHYSNNRRIPDYLCSKCFRQYNDQLDEPWLKYLFNKERYRRMKRQRRAATGTNITEISLDQLSEAGYTIPSTILKDNEERSKPKRRPRT